MAQARNSFIKSKMNKDLDSRLMPSGEYRDAQNVSVSKSEGADVGSLENILGNISLTDFGLTSFDQKNIDVIGFFMDVNSSRIFVFMTNFVDTSNDRLSNFAPIDSQCHIAVYNNINNDATILVSGNFLNFSKTNPILGVNLIQDSLFFTDNRNQPRKINVSRATNSPSLGVQGALVGSLFSSITTNPTGIDDGNYTAQVGITAGVTSDLIGSNAILSITVAGNTITIVDVSDGGKNFVADEKITITSALLLNANVSAVITITKNNLQPVYYISEDQISLAKYYPYQPISLIEDQVVGISSFTSGVGFTPAGGIITNMPTSGGTGAGLTVNVIITGPGSVFAITQTVAGTGYAPGQVLNAIGGNGSGLKILINSGIGSGTIVATGSGYLNGDTVTTETRASQITATYTVAVSATSGRIGAETINSFGNQDYSNGDVLTLEPIAAGSGATLTLAVESTSTMKDVVSEDLPDNASPNPFYNANWPGDKDFLKERFVRFAYRFKFDDGEYSLISPFTQECFVPEQDGYFVNDDEDRTYKSTEVDFMKNKINDIKLIFNKPLESKNWGEAVEEFKINYIEIIYKDSSVGLLKLLDTINSNSFSSSLKSTISYDYQSAKPYKDLPIRDLLRVYDQTPVRALSQEVTGNRLIFGNFVDKHTPPETLNYTTSIGFKDENAGSDAGIEYSEIRKEYQNHTLKQDRNYQIGVVLSDRYGRQSDVILSNIISNSQNSILKGSTIFNPYKPGAIDNVPDTGSITALTFDGTDNFSYYNTSLNASPLTNRLLNSTDTWPGDQLKINFLTNISSVFNSNTGTPGLYNISNPTGWYSYKAVVKQDQTDYYNVYCPGVLNGYVDGETANPLAASEEEPIFHFALYSDNLSKIPKDISIVGPNQNVFKTGRPSFSEDPDYYNFTDTNGNLFQVDPYTAEGETLLKTRDRERDLDSGSQIENSSIKLSTRVINYYNDQATGQNKARTRQYYPGKITEIVTAIGTGDDLGLFSVGNIVPFPFNTAPVFYNFQSNPFIARMSMYSTTSAQGITFFGQIGPSPDAAEYEISLGAISAAGTDYPATGAINIPVSFAGATATDNLFKNKDLKIKFSANAGGVTEVGITDNGDGWQTIGLTAGAPTKTATATISGFGNGDATFPVTITRNTFGPEDGLLPIFSVFETKPLISKLDIYWETSTTGVISDLNTRISLNDEFTPYGFCDVASDETGTTATTSLSFLFNENFGLLTDLAGLFKSGVGNLGFLVASDSGEPITTSNVALLGYEPVVTLISVTDSAPTPNDITSQFEVYAMATLADGSQPYNIRNTVYRYFGNNSANNDIFNFKLRVVSPTINYLDDGISTTRDLDFSVVPSNPFFGFNPPRLTNVIPSINPISQGPNAVWNGTPGCSGEITVSANTTRQLAINYIIRNGTNLGNIYGIRRDMTVFFDAIANPELEPGGTLFPYFTIENTPGNNLVELFIEPDAYNQGFGTVNIPIVVQDGGGLTAVCSVAVNAIG